MKRTEVYGVGEERGLLFYAMRFVAGPTLGELRERLAAERTLHEEPGVRRLLVQRVDRSGTPAPT